MDLGQRIKEVDLNYPVENVTVNGKQFWPFFKVFFFDAQFVQGGTQTVFSISQKLKFALSSFYGIFQWFGKTDYLVFSNSDQRKKINGMWVDKSADYLNLTLSNTLHIELPVFKHFSRSLLPYRRVVSHLPLRFLEVAYVELFLRKVNVQGLDTLTTLTNKYGVTIPIKALGKRFLAQYCVMKWVLRFTKPKMVFMAVPYMKMGYVLAAKELGIKVVEMQHGTINKSHFGYNNFKKFDKRLFPNYLFAYGEGIKSVFTEGNITFESKNIFPIGHYYLDLIQKNGSKKNGLKAKLASFDLSIAVSLQDDSIGSQITSYISEISMKRPNWALVLVPRKTPQSEYESEGMPSNIFFDSSLNVYEVMNTCDFHTTVFSTCALEAPVLGKPNVLINVGNKSKEYYEKILIDKRVTRIVETSDEFINAIESGSFPSEQEIKDSNNHVIVSGFDENLKKALGSLKI